MDLFVLMGYLLSFRTFSYTRYTLVRTIHYAVFIPFLKDKTRIFFQNETKMVVSRNSRVRKNMSENTPKFSLCVLSIAVRYKFKILSLKATGLKGQAYIRRSVA